MILRRPLDGIWHSGIVVYNTEYFFGGGICSAPKGQTPFGVPTKIEHLGETEIPIELFLEFLESIKSSFTINTYNVISKNCNHFTNEVCNFLLGKDIPHSVLK